MSIYVYNLSEHFDFVELVSARPITGKERGGEHLFVKSHPPIGLSTIEDQNILSIQKSSKRCQRSSKVAFQKIT